MKQSILLVFGALIVGLIIGNLTAPKTIEDNQKVIDSLKRDIQARERKINEAIDSMNHYKVLSETWFQVANENIKKKTIYKTIYLRDTARNNSFTLDQLDSAFRAKYGSNYAK